VNEVCVESFALQFDPFLRRAVWQIPEKNRYRLFLSQNLTEKLY